ncbi:hypothetical protein [Streptomyces sp. NPDC093589]|uniref:hypothetical protein n=1 Tax=Streptomyces sp. NPDC093589 TaxID=3366043 RepID=UPI0037F723BF
MSATSRASARKALTNLDHRIEAAVGRTVDVLWTQYDRKLLDAPHGRLVEAHRGLAQASTAVTFHRVLLQRLASGEFPLDEALMARVDRTVVQLKESIATRDERHRHVLDALEPIETATRTGSPGRAARLSAPDVASLLAIAQGAKLHQHLLTHQMSVVTASGARVAYHQLQHLEDAGLVVRDTSHPVHAGQPVTLTDTGRTAVTGPRHTAAAPAAAPQPAGAWPSSARSRR